MTSSAEEFAGGDGTLSPSRRRLHEMSDLQIQVSYSLPSVVCRTMAGTVRFICKHFRNLFCIAFRRCTGSSSSGRGTPTGDRGNDLASLVAQSALLPADESSRGRLVLTHEADESSRGMQMCDSAMPHIRASPAYAEELVGPPSEPGLRRVAGFLLSETRLPPGSEGKKLDGLVSEIQQLCSQVAPISRQGALRLTLGMAFDPAEALKKWREVVAWRQEHDMDAVRWRLTEFMLGNQTVQFSHESEVYSRLFRGCPCALVTADGRPVSVWHGGTLDAGGAADLCTEIASAWSREVFEYADAWVSRESERTGRLQGYVQVFNMEGLRLRHVTSKEIAEKLKAALSAGGFYVEAVAHIYVINASKLFEIAWKLVRSFLSPVTASKITVSSSMPQELVEELGGPSAPALAQLNCLMKAAAQGSGADGSPLAAVLRPPLPAKLSTRKASDRSEVTSVGDTEACMSVTASSNYTGACSSREPEAAEEVLQPGAQLVAGFWLREQQLPPGLEGRDLETLVAEVWQSCSEVSQLSRQQALRLTLGMGYDPFAALAKWREVVAWRKEHKVDTIRRKQVEAMCGAGLVQFTNEAEVYSNLITVSPCALLTADGCPVSLWYARTLNSSGASVSVERAAAWSREVFEYKDLWIMQQSEVSGRLLGYVQVYDMSGLSWWHYSSREITEKLKALLQPGGFYVEAVAHMYVINASTLFSMAWKVVRNLISPWTASKITVSSGIPNELLGALGGSSSPCAQELQRLLGEAGTSPLAPVLRPGPLTLQALQQRAMGKHSQEARPSPVAAVSDCAIDATTALHGDKSLESAPVPAGMQRVAGFLLRDEQLPPGLEGRDLQAIVAEVCRCCSEVRPITKQQGLRLTLGMGYDITAARAKWREVVSWREAHEMSAIRQAHHEMMRGDGAVCFSNDEEVYSKLISARPCALLAANGCPVSLWHAGTLNISGAPSLASEQAARFSREVFEYKDLWISEESDRTGSLLGYVQVYDMQGLSWWQYSSREITEKVKAVLQPGGFYVEAVAHMYVINASTLFSMAWKVISSFISPWTASKITVSSGVPDELIDVLGGPSAPAVAELRRLLRSPAQGATSVEVLRPRVQEASGMSGIASGDSL
eukprot:TRINITY_DN8449_c0_g1_i1.p1 TRINITY_DN8449_c0_g1~~TRINITY_DN8449_c0_g1_i1.p1  ORF type:complete len:1117 (-),score=203.84 TRINITY_DN8449_c0_g1_i1:48-3398(-)